MVFQKGKVLMGTVFLVLGVVLLQATNIPQNTMFSSPNEMAAMTYPRFLIYGWLIASVIYLLIPAEPIYWADFRQSLPHLVQVAASIGCYILMFTYLGLALSTFLFLLIFFYVMKYRKWKYTLSIALLGAFLTWLVFEQILGVSMPQSLLMELFY